MARTIKSVLDEIEQRCDGNITDANALSDEAYDAGDVDKGEKYKHHSWAFKCVKRWIGEMRSVNGEEFTQ